MNTSDEVFKANFDSEVRSKRSTLMLRTSFHLINIVLMGLCKLFKTLESEVVMKRATSKGIKSSPVRVHKINLKEVMVEIAELCFYDITEENSCTLEVVEHYPSVFKDIREITGVSEDYLFQSLAPLHNIQAIHNFFTGTGKSQSFFFFSDNKAFVLKTLKESEKKLLLE
jgi:hypothetical protein